MDFKPALITLVVLAFTGAVIEANTLSNVRAIYNRYKKKMSGDGTYYGNYGGGGKCSLDPLAIPNGWIPVAAGPANYQESLGCGMCLEITGTGKGSGNNPIVGTKKAMVVDYCAECGNGMDFAINGDGRWKIHHKAIDCPTTGNIQLRFQGSNPWYIKLQARNTKVPTAGLEVKVNGKYRCLTRVPDNFFEGRNLGKVSTPLRVRLTSITGEQVETTIRNIENGVNIPSNVQYKGIKSGSPGKIKKIKCFGQGA